MKKLLSSAVFLFVFTIVSAQPFQNTFDLGSDDYANMSFMDGNGDIYSVGSSSYLGAGGYDAILVKSDPSGSFVWHKQYGEAQTEFGSVITQAASGYVIAGRSNSFTNGNDDILLIKTDFDGDLQWAKTYGLDSLEDYATHVGTTLDNGYIVTGMTRNYGSGGQDAFLLKTDSLGEVDWFNTYGSNSDEIGYFVSAVDDGGFVLFGVSRGPGGAGLNDMYLVKTDSTGAIEAQFLIGGAGDDEGRRALGSNSGLVLAGRMSDSGNPFDIFVGELNISSFTFNWFNTYGGSADEGIGSLVQLPGGDGYAVAGITQSFGTGVEGLAIALDTSGSVGFAFTLEGSSNDFIQDITLANDGAIVTGYSDSYGGTANDIYIAKVGNNPLCHSNSVNLTVTPHTPSLAGPVLPNHSATAVSLTANTVTLTQTTTLATQTDICSFGMPLSVDAGPDALSCGGVSVMIGGNPTASGGTPPYSYSWSPATDLDDPAAANPNAGPSTTTVYSVTVTDDVGDTATSSLTVNVFSQSPVITITTMDVSCLGGDDGTAVADASSGGGGFAYSWSNTATTDSISGLTAGIYSVTVTDMNGCTAEDIAIIGEPATAVTAATSATTSTGSDGTATVTAGGGTPPYSYEWDTNPAQDSTTATGLAPGTYTVTVTDDNGCTVSTTADVPAGLSADAGSDGSSCAGLAIMIGGNPTANGGFPPFTYSWSPSSGLSDETIANPFASPLSPTTYSVTVTDNSGATATDDVQVTVFPLTPSVTVTSTDVLCFMGNDGTATAAGSGGAGTLSYSWSNGATTDSLTGLTKGTYIVTVSDDNGCLAIDSANVDHPNFVRTWVSSTPSSGSNGTATIDSVTGGTPPYTYSWSTGDTTQTITGLAPGTYRATSIDSHGCTDSRTIDVLSAPSITADAGTDKTICAGGQTQIGGSPAASGGTAPYSYSWSPASGLSNATAANPTASPTATTTYTLVVADNGGTTATDAVVVTVNPVPNVTAGNDVTICDTSSATLTASGADTYAWSPAAGLSATNIASPVASPTATTTYTVVGTTSGCTASESVTVTVTPCTGIRDLVRVSMTLFPNPANDVVNISIFSDGYSTGSLSVIAIDGRTVSRHDATIAAGMNTITVNTGQIAPGLYYIRFESSKMLSIGKVIIE